MSQQKRQTNLFAAEDWTVIYQTFREISLQAYDFDTIKDAMIDHIRSTYPDDFNDWINNQEFIFLLDTIAFVGQNLSFRMDLNSRENFIATATRKESILRLANTLSYNPKRNYPARGLLKITEIQTTEDIRDSFGNSVQNVPILWNDELNDNWREQFILVMNSVFTSSSQFGSPIKTVTVNATKTNLYQMNSIEFDALANGFTKSIAGNSYQFEVVNPDFDNNGTFFERTPDPQDNKHVIYRSDGNGDASIDTGFFMYFKQGTLSYVDFDYNTKIESRLQDLSPEGINEIDLWVQSVNGDGSVSANWSSVPDTTSLSYNSIDSDTRNVYSVNTRDLDQVSVQFPSTTTGAIPYGVFRFWYRTSNGSSYTIKTSDMSSVQTSYSYTSSGGTNANVETLSIVADLQYEILNSQAAETTEQIRERAPRHYYTQDRVITGEDYNFAPLAQGNIVLKSKALNRTYSGHSLFSEVKDPTGTYQNINIISDDGLLYEYLDITSSPLTSMNSSLPENIIKIEIEPILQLPEVKNLFFRTFGTPIPSTSQIDWITINGSSNTIGKFFIDGVEVQNEVEFNDGNVVIFDNEETGTIVGDQNISGELYHVLSDAVESGTVISQYINVPSFTSFTSSEISDIETVMLSESEFGLSFDNSGWKPIEEDNKSVLITPLQIDSFVDGTNWVLWFKFDPDTRAYSVFIRGLYYVFESKAATKFYFTNTIKQTDINTGATELDHINILEPSTSGLQKKRMNVSGSIRTNYGYSDPNKIRVSYEVNQLGDPKLPEFFDGIVRETDLYWIITSQLEEPHTITDEEFKSFGVLPIDVPETEGYYVTSDKLELRYFDGIENSFILDITGNVAYIEDDGDDLTVKLGLVYIDTDEFVLKSKTFDGYSIVYRKGTTENQIFQYKHYAEDFNRIDPAITNLIDIYVLTTEYYNNVISWISLNENARGNFPEEPTSFEIKTTFSDIESIKAVSDTVIWHSANFRRLFGSVNDGDEDLQATFKILRISGSTISDNELKQGVINSINTFFDIDNWDFGDSFFFTELSAYIHQQMSTDIASVVIVPKNGTTFGTLFEIPSNSYELFISTATVNDVEIITGLTPNNLNY